MNPESHRTVRESLGAFALGHLDADEAAGVRAHVDGCADCRAEVAELAAAAHSLGALSEATPPPSLRASVLSGISQVRPLPPLREDAVAPVPDAASSAGTDPPSCSASGRSSG